jgi:hypothetical protein
MLGCGYKAEELPLSRNCPCRSREVKIPCIWHKSLRKTVANTGGVVFVLMMMKMMITRMIEMAEFVK